MNRFSLEGRTGVVTGGAGGLGRAMAEAIVEAGGRVTILDVDGDAARATASAIGPNASARELDVASRDTLRTAIADVADTYGRLDIAIANAGISAGPGYQTPKGQIASVSDEMWDRVIDVNLTSVFVTIQAAGRIMARQGKGSIIVISSIAGLRSESMVGYGYAATKAAAVNLVRQAAMEFAPKGVRVNGIAPGPFRTNIGGGRIRDPEVEKAFIDMVPMGRIADPEEIKGLALYLASDASSFMTGTNIPIDGGITAA
jgi:NAD(P)-dependent dehydrogenase (short-subunit alcohol dehydrogenase family)